MSDTAAKPRRRSDGERTRRAILGAAARLATVEGLNGLSLGRLADHIGMSKSGLFAHFGSKEELQLATIDAALEVFEVEVMRPGLSAPTPLARLDGLCTAFLSHVDRGVFPGGCFFASTAAELDTRPGAVRDRIVQIAHDWDGLFQQLVRDAQAAGELRAEDDPAQLSFELNALLSYGNAEFVLGDRSALDRARAAIAVRLAASRL